MEKKSKKELLQIIEDQGQNLLKYKTRLHDIVESYKRLLKEKETLENSIKTLTEVITVSESDTKTSTSDAESENDGKISSNKNDLCIQQLKASIGTLTIEKSRVENELKADRKLLLQQKEELENTLSENEDRWFTEKEKYEKHILELRKKVGVQQREREKEQHDHVLMLKELQNVVAVDRVTKEKLEEQMGEMQQKFSHKIPDRKALEYEKVIEDLQNKLTMSQDHVNSYENELKRSAIALQKSNEITEEIKLQYLMEIEREKERADLTERKSELITLTKEKRIAVLEARISELSTVVGEHDKLRQQDLNMIQKLKARVVQLQAECSAFVQTSTREQQRWGYGDVNASVKSAVGCLKELRSVSDPGHAVSEEILLSESPTESSNNSHAPCQEEILRLKDELEQYKSKAEMALKEKYSKTSAALLSDAKTGKEMKELKSRVTQLQDHLQNCKSQLKLNEEYHGRITANLEKSAEELRVQHRQELSQLGLSHRATILELEHQIQKQRERTLSLLEEKDKEIELLKSSFVASIVKKDELHSASSDNHSKDASSACDPETSSNLIPSSLISSQKDGHILFYVQELARRDVELSNVRHVRIRTESALRKLQQKLELVEQKYEEDVESLRSRIRLLESSQDEEGTNVEYLKNVVLMFLKCNDASSRRHMINAISTILHFTTNEMQEVKDHM